MQRYWKFIPPLRSLLALEATARHASFSGAARELNISQSAVSHAVTTAEKFLGVQLIDRTTRPISLTADGTAYMATLTGCLNQLMAAGKSLQRSPSHSTLTISCNLATGNYWLLPRLKFFHLAYPNQQINLVTTYQGPALLDDDIDVAVRFGDGNWPDGASHLLFQERIVPVATQEYLDRNPRIGCPADLLDHTLLHALSLERSWFDWYQWFEHFGVAMKGGLPGPSFDNHLLMMQAALSGRGVALGWIGTASDLISQGHLVKALDSPIALSTGIYAVARKEHQEQVEPFINWLTATAATEIERLSPPFT